MMTEKNSTITPRFELSRMLGKGLKLQDNVLAFSKKAGRSTNIHPIQ